ncbi:hypothetical protein BU26DRAFT_507488 [Trematosphaeria pertusa]|uniref:Uncharacterized protein n=1 Tax=Trematosphaeria pertusa TaxID=390896 RepID=A0A6A6I658_9PLEO|nr:uncharacterized protein BU26DRAFT_507488 [Trematosphaeria pertusa]KAF2245796.1 hypothetical protein BU26DRAFT_507488 [Trematosphaeria pertusa]
MGSHKFAACLIFYHLTQSVWTSPQETFAPTPTVEAQAIKLQELGIQNLDNVDWKKFWKHVPARLPDFEVLCGFGEGDPKKVPRTVAQENVKTFCGDKKGKGVTIGHPLDGLFDFDDNNTLNITFRQSPDCGEFNDLVLDEGDCVANLNGPIDECDENSSDIPGGTAKDGCFIYILHPQNKPAPTQEPRPSPTPSPTPEPPQGDPKSLQIIYETFISTGAEEWQAWTFFEGEQGTAVDPCAENHIKQDKTAPGATGYDTPFIQGEWNLRFAGYAEDCIFQGIGRRGENGDVGWLHCPERRAIMCLEDPKRGGGKDAWKNCEKGEWSDDRIPMAYCDWS